MISAGCCCCPNFYILANEDIPSCYLPIRNVGDYPNNTLELDINESITPFSSGMSVDLRNKLIFASGAIGGGLVGIRRYNMDDLSEAPVLIHSFVPTNSFSGCCCDWFNGRVYFSAGISGPPNNEWGIYAINYDGSGLFQVASEQAPVDEAGDHGQLSILHMMWEPTNSNLYYAKSFPFFWRHPDFPTPPISDTNAFTHLRMVQPDFGFPSTILSLENKTDTAGDWTIRGLGMSVASSRLVWIEGKGTGTAADPHITMYLKTGELDASGPTTLIQHEVTDGPLLHSCKVNQFNNYIYYEELTSPGGTNTSRLMKMTMEGGDQQQVLDDFQENLFVSGEHSYRQPGGLMRFQFGCGEDKSDPYAGPCCSSV